ncbi:MAG: NYN domain-containing protein [Acidobacteria bacterium]|nr:NYN domain-containing protein [Acidobacteriota bacterium]
MAQGHFVIGERVAVLLDGESVRITLGSRLKRFPEAADVVAEVSRILVHPAVERSSLYRVFYYTAEPLSGSARNPLDGRPIDFSATLAYARNMRLIERLDDEPDFAVRRGTLVHQGWEIGRAAAHRLTSGLKTTVGAHDLVPKILQKGVDMRIGLDMASLALKRFVSSVVVVTGDSDLVPAMRFARREGIRVYLDTLGHPHVRPELKTHADQMLG